jgi:enoyl-[acyl-carrier protein] reductase II
MSQPDDHPCHVFTRRLGVRYPIVQGGMTFGSDARLVAAVSEAGGLGTLGTFHYRTHENVRPQVAAIRAATSRPFAVNVPFFEASFALVEKLAREDGVKVFTLGGWFSADMARLKEELGLTVLVSVNAPTVARMVAERPLDALIVQGNESGGANSHYSTEQLFDLVRPIVPAGTPILWAGGQWDGHDLHRALLRGAAGVQLGTRFFFSEESPLHPTIKAQVVESNAKRPLTTALTPVNDTLSMRFITNKAYKTALKAGEVEKIFQDKERVFALSQAFFEANERPLLLYAGTGVYKLRAVEPCRAIVEGIVDEYEALLATRLPSLRAD